MVAIAQVKESIRTKLYRCIAASRQEDLGEGPSARSVYETLDRIIC
jgi:hypothetical protein